MNWNKFFEEYNKCVSEAINTIIEKASSIDELGTMEHMQSVFLNINDKVNEWKGKNSANLGGISPQQMVDEISNIKQVEEILKIGAQTTDLDIPPFMIEKFKTFGDEGVKLLMDLALSISWEAPDDPEQMPKAEHFISITALKILGFWENKQALIKVSEKLEETTFPFEFMVDAYEDFIACFAEESFSVLVNILNSASKPENEFKVVHEHMLSMLVQMTPESKASEAFECVRDSFRKMNDKIVGVICLGNLGNPRGIAVIKTFIDTGLADNDKELFYEAMSSIKSLGGDITDIHDPFRDFA